MNFSAGITEFNTSYNLNAIDDYNRFLQGNALSVNRIEWRFV